MSILNKIYFDGKGNKIQKSFFINNNLERKIYKNNDILNSPEKIIEIVDNSNEINK